VLAQNLTDKRRVAHVADIKRHVGRDGCTVSARQIIEDNHAFASAPQ
jgi:hypothetical protein